MGRGWVWQEAFFLDPKFLQLCLLSAFDSHYQSLRDYDSPGQPLAVSFSQWQLLAFPSSQWQSLVEVEVEVNDISKQSLTVTEN